ncbi:uncharacterized protein LOC135819881 [Sycon ciliatum]|uniref:uncharacterized protein LOC135819881 n=1 Tax=Sycon ciliatum TaxID=27933 RepID=UPI0031F6F931
MVRGAYTLYAVLVIAAGLRSALAGNVEVHIDTSKAVATVPEYFRGFTCDWWRHNNPSYGDDWRMAGMLTLDLTSTRLKKMFTNLVPALWRIGGTPEDEVVYAIGNAPECPPDQIQNSTNYPGPLCLTPERFKDIVMFAHETGVHLAFGLSGAYGRASGKDNFNSTNSHELLKYAAANKLPIFAFELSNEKNGWDPVKLGEDFNTVRGYINELWPDEATRPLLVGPDTASTPWMKTFFGTAGKSLNASTFHTYCNGYTTCEQTMLNPKVLDGCINAAVSTIEYTREGIPSNPNMPVWAGEDGPHSGGGRPNCTDRFADAYWYLDHLATLALHGVQAFARSTMVGANYGLLNRTTFEPHPDYYAALLWGRLMGTSHLNVTTGSADGMLRAYTTCRNRSTVVILLMNLDTEHNHTAMLAPPASSTRASSGSTAYQMVYMLAATGGLEGMYADDVSFLQDGQFKVLRLGADDSLPDLTPTKDTFGQVNMPPLSYAFVELDSNAATCSV